MIALSQFQPVWMWEVNSHWSYIDIMSRCQTQRILQTRPTMLLYLCITKLLHKKFLKSSSVSLVLFMRTIGMTISQFWKLQELRSSAKLFKAAAPPLMKKQKWPLRHLVKLTLELNLLWLQYWRRQQIGAELRLRIVSMGLAPLLIDTSSTTWTTQSMTSSLSRPTASSMRRSTASSMRRNTAIVYMEMILRKESHMLLRPLRHVPLQKKSQSTPKSVEITPLDKTTTSL